MKRTGARPTPRKPSSAARPAPRALPGEVLVNGHATHWIGERFPWLYPEEVLSGHPGRAGIPLVLRGAQGQVLGTALSDTGRLAGRVFRFGEGALDAAWISEVVDDALALRTASVRTPETTAMRLIHCENDGLPGVRVDLWGDVLQFTLDTPSVASLLAPLITALRARVPAREGWLAYRADPRDSLDFSSVKPPAGRLWGPDDAPDEVEVLERGMKMLVRPAEGPDTGLYVDMRDVRRFLAPHFADRRVLNLFAYTGAFSVAALLGGATHVTSVDLSARSLERARKNVEINGLSQDRHEVIEADVFRTLDRLRRQGESFDLVIADPPSFSHSAQGMWSVAKDLPRLTAACARVSRPRGWLVLASNHGQTSPRVFRGAVADGLRKAGRFAREVAFLGASVDVPAAVSFPEGHYLKVGVWALSPEMT